MIDKESRAIVMVGCTFESNPTAIKQRNINNVSCLACRKAVDWAVETETVEAAVGRLAANCPRLSPEFRGQIAAEGADLSSTVRGDGSHELVVPVAVTSGMTSLTRNQRS